MSILLPLFSYLLLSLIFYKRKAINPSLLRESLLSAGLVWSTFVVFGIELLSFFHQLIFAYLLAYWILIILGLSLIYFFIPKNKEKNFLNCDLSKISKSEKFFASAIIAILLVTFFIALNKPPNIWDSMVYHLSRVSHWIQNKTVAYYPTGILKQLYLAPFPEFVITHFQILSGSDQFACLVQWLCMLGSLLGISLIAKRFGLSSRGQILSVVFAVTLPMSILQSTGTQTDHVAGFFMICLCYFILLFVQGDQSWKTIVHIALSLGLAFLSKATTFIFAFPFCLWVFGYGLKYFRSRVWKRILVVVLIVLSINAGFFIRNINAFKSPLYSGEEHYTNEVFSLPAFASNVLKNISLHLITPFEGINVKTANVIKKLHDYIGISDSDERTSWMPFVPSNILLDTDVDGNPLHFILLVWGLFCFIFYGSWKKDEILFGYVLCVFFSALLFCFVLTWQAFHSRLHLSLFLISSPLCGILLSKMKKQSIANSIAIILLISSLPWLFLNNSCPLMGSDSMFKTKRIQKYFTKNPGLEFSYRKAIEEIIDDECKDVGLVLSFNSWEYPVWVMFDELKQKDVRIEHVNLKNESQAIPYPLGPFKPCAILSDFMRDGDKPLIVFDATSYVKTRRLTYLSSFFEDSTGKLERKSLISGFVRTVKYLNQSNIIYYKYDHYVKNVDDVFDAMMGFRIKALKEAKEIENDYLDRVHEGLAKPFNEFLVKGLELNVKGFQTSNDSLMKEGESLIHMWNAWFQLNKEALKVILEE